MNYFKMLSVVLFCSASVANASTAHEYVKVCETQSSTVAYTGMTVPGTDQCLNMPTGMIQTGSAHGVVTSQTILSQRIVALEAELVAIEKEFGLSEPE